MENLPWKFHGIISVESFPFNSMEYKTGTSEINDSPVLFENYSDLLLCCAISV